MRTVTRRTGLTSVILTIGLLIVALWPSTTRAAFQQPIYVMSTAGPKPATGTSAGVMEVAIAPQTSGGASGLKYTSAGATEDEHAVKATAGVLYSITATNTNADERYLRCSNATAANTTPGTTTPIIDLAIPGNASGAGFTFSLPYGLTFSTALTCWTVTGAADTDVAEVAANEIKLLYTFK